MSKDRLYSQKFKCECGEKMKKLIWESKINDFENYPKCKCGKTTDLHFEEINESPMMIIGKMNPSQIRNDRLKRSNDHFKKEIYHTLAKEDRKLLAHKNKKS